MCLINTKISPTAVMLEGLHFLTTSGLYWETQFSKKKVLFFYNLLKKALLYDQQIT